MTGQETAFSVSIVIEGNLGEEEEHIVLRDEVFVLARKGQTDLNRESLSMAGEGSSSQVSTCIYREM